MSVRNLRVNGPTRRTLSEELDRLDAILDGLAEALQGEVADTVKATVGAAAREALAEAVRGLAHPTIGTDPAGGGSPAVRSNGVTRRLTRGAVIGVMSRA